MGDFVDTGSAVAGRGVHCATGVKDGGATGSSETVPEKSTVVGFGETGPAVVDDGGVAGSSETVPENSTVVGEVVVGFVDGADAGSMVGLTLGMCVHFATGFEDGEVTTGASETVPDSEGIGSVDDEEAGFMDGADDDCMDGLTLGRGVHIDTGFNDGEPLGASEKDANGSVVVGFGDENEGITTGAESGLLEGELNGCVEERASGWEDTAGLGEPDMC